MKIEIPKGRKAKPQSTPASDPIESVVSPFSVLSSFSAFTGNHLSLRSVMNALLVMRLSDALRSASASGFPWWLKTQPNHSFSASTSFYSNRYVELTERCRMGQ